MERPRHGMGMAGGVNKKLKVSGMGLIPLFYYTGPFEDIELK